MKYSPQIFNIKIIKRLFILLLFIATGCAKPNNKTVDVDTIIIVGNPEESIVKIDSALALNNNDLSKGKLLSEKGKQYSKMHLYNKSSEYYLQAIQYLEKSKSNEDLAKTYANLGSASTMLTKKEQAIKQLLKALNYNEIVKNKKVEANIYSSLSYAYFQFKDLDKSIVYMMKTLNINKALKDSTSISSAYNNLAILYRNMRDYNKAFEYNKKSLDINIKLKDSNSIAKSYNNLGLVSNNLGYKTRAANYYKMAAKINEEKSILNAFPLVNLGDYYYNIPDFKNAEKWYLKALAIEKKSENYRSSKDIYDNLLYIKLKDQNFEEAVIYKNKRDSVYEVQYKLDLKEKLSLVENQFELASKENDLKQIQEINKRNKTVFAAIIGIFLLLSLLLFQYIKTKSLKNEKEKVDLEQNVLRSQMNPHFIFNALSAIQNSLLDNDPLKSATYLSRFAQLIRQNFDAVNKETISLKEEITIIENYIATQKLRFEDKFDFELHTSNDLDLNEIMIPPLFLQPFIENSIEHGFKDKKDKGLLSITITQKGDRVFYEIKDNGKGFKNKKKDNKTHAIDVFIRRLKLLGNNDEKTFSIKSSQKGTIIKFALKL